MLTGEVQQRIAGRWRTVLTAGGIPVDDRRRRPAERDQVAPPPDALLAAVFAHYARGSR